MENGGKTIVETPIERITGRVQAMHAVMLKHENIDWDNLPYHQKDKFDNCLNELVKTYTRHSRIGNSVIKLVPRTKVDKVISFVKNIFKKGKKR